MDLFFPSQLEFEASQSSDGRVDVLRTMALSNGLPLGCYVYNIILSGPSTSEYVVLHNPPLTQFCVVSKNYIPAAPTLVSAEFSNDGAYIQIQFDSPTNRVGYTSSIFVCGQLFDFTCSSSSQCQWIDYQTINAFVSGTTVSSRRLPVPGSSIMILPSVAIKAACRTSSKGICTAPNSWPNATRSALTIKEPLFATPPIVVITIPNSIGLCDALTLDVTSSTGNGGRPWVRAAAVLVGIHPL